MPVGFVIAKIAPFEVQRILQFPGEHHGEIGMIFLEYAKGDSRFLRTGIPVALFRMEDMPEPVLTKTGARPLFHGLICLLDIPRHDADGLWFFRKDHSPR